MCYYKAGLLLYTLLVFADGLKIFLQGGGVTDKQADVWNAMAQQTGKIQQPYTCGEDWSTTKCPKVAVITSAAQNEEDGNYYYEINQPNNLGYKNLFIKFGFSPKHISVHRDNYLKTTDLNLPQGQRNFQILKSADLIFFDGGDQIRHARCWFTDEGNKTPLFQLIVDRAMSDDVILGGMSAGTMIWSKIAYGGGSSLGYLYFSELVGLAPKQIKDGAMGGTGLYDIRNGTSGFQYEYNAGKFQGFGFFPYLLDTHFDKRGRLGRIIPALIQTNQQLGIGVDQPSCLYYNNGIGKVYGQKGVFIVDITNATGNKKTYFSTNNVQVSYLSVGDSFDFKTKTFTPSSTKSLILSPQYNSHHDSNDILSSYECTLVLSRLVDQIPSFNVGRTKLTQGYPYSVPTFRFVFEKNAQTKGYYDKVKKIYSVSKALVHVSYQ